MMMLPNQTNVEYAQVSLSKDEDSYLSDSVFPFAREEKASCSYLAQEERDEVHISSDMIPTLQLTDQFFVSCKFDSELKKPYSVSDYQRTSSAETRNTDYINATPPKYEHKQSLFNKLSATLQQKVSVNERYDPKRSPDASPTKTIKFTFRMNSFNNKDQEVNNENLSPISKEKPENNNEDRSSPTKQQVAVKSSITKRKVFVEVFPENKYKESPSNKSSLSSGKICKICLDSNESAATGLLKSPCRCTGSMRFIHEECLKTWIISKKQEIDKATCELCKNSYNMTFKMGLKFFPRNAKKEGLLSCISSICLAMLILCLLTVIIVISAKWKVQVETEHNGSIDLDTFSYNIAIIVCCSAVAVILFFLLYLSVKEALFIYCIVEWKIINWEHVGVMLENSQSTSKAHKNADLKSSKGTRPGCESIKHDSESPLVSINNNNKNNKAFLSRRRNCLKRSRSHGSSSSFNDHLLRRIHSLI